MKVYGYEYMNHDDSSVNYTSDKLYKTRKLAQKAMRKVANELVADLNQVGDDDEYTPYATVDTKNDDGKLCISVVNNNEDPLECVVEVSYTIV